MSPKKIHYCWFGKGPKPQIFESCLKSWKKFAPDYEIIEWNEENFDIARFPFAQQAYDCKKYAFVSDIARLSVLYDHGGVYLDTDVELLAPLERFENDECFFFFQNVLNIATGLGFGSEAGHPILQKLLDDYADRRFDTEHMADIICPRLTTTVFRQALPGFVANNQSQVIQGVCVYDTRVYDAHAIHHDQFSWMSDEHREAMRYVRKKRPNYRIREALRSPKIFGWFDRLHLKRIKKIYLFIVYDLIEYGVVYWCYRAYQKIRKKICGHRNR